MSTIHTVHTYLRVWVHTYLRGSVHTYLRGWVHTYLKGWVHTYLRVWVHTYLRGWVHTYLRVWVHTYLRGWVHTYLRGWDGSLQLDMLSLDKARTEEKNCFQDWLTLISLLFLLQYGFPDTFRSSKCCVEPLDRAVTSYRQVKQHRKMNSTMYYIRLKTTTNYHSQRWELLLETAAGNRCWKN